MKKLLLSLLMVVLSMGIASAQKFAYVDTDYILENVPEYNAAQDQLDELSATMQKEIETKFTEIDKLYKAFQTEAVLLPEDMKKKKQEEIVAKEKEAKELQKKYFGKEGDLAKKRTELVKPIQDKVYAAIQTVATEGAYAFIFDKSGGVTMLYANNKYDESDNVLGKMGYKPGGYKKETKTTGTK